MQISDEKMRNRVYRLDKQELLISHLVASNEAKDAYTRINCDGFGRRRVFRNYLMHAAPTEDVAKRVKRFLAFGYPNPTGEVQSQVFQLSGCSWRCWYCYVDNKLLAGNERYGHWFHPDTLIDLWQKDENPTQVLDLSGGQPDLVPEWVVLTARGLTARRFKGPIYFRSEDNLSNDFWLTMVKPEDRELVYHSNYTRIACLKGFDERSFSFNTSSSTVSFETQLDLLSKLKADRGLRMFCHLTLTGPPMQAVEVRKKINVMIDKLRSISYLLPLSVVPLLIRKTPVWEERKVSVESVDLGQETERIAVDCWFDRIDKIYSPAERALSLESCSC